MALKIYVLLNPLATRLRTISRPALEHFAELLKDRLTGDAEIFVGISHDFEGLSSMLKALETIRPDLIISLGGDGTVSHLVDCAYKTFAPPSPLPYFLFLPGGQFNIVSKSIKTALPRWSNGLKFAGKVADLLAKGRADRLEIYPLHPLKVRLDRKDLYCFNVSFLNAPQLLADIYAIRHNRSKYLWGASQLIGLIKRKLDVETLVIRYGDNGRWRSVTAPASTLFMASTVNEIAFGLKFCHRAQERPGFFHLVTASRNPQRSMRDFIGIATVDFLNVYFKRNGSFRKTDIVTDRAEVRWPANPGAYSLTIDGEIRDLSGRPYMASSLVLETAERPLRAIVNYR